MFYFRCRCSRFGVVHAFLSRLELHGLDRALMDAACLSICRLRMMLGGPHAYGRDGRRRRAGEQVLNTGRCMKLRPCVNGSRICYNAMG